MPPVPVYSGSGYGPAIPKPDGRAYVHGLLPTGSQLYLLNPDGSRDVNFALGQPNESFSVAGGVSTADGRTYLYGSFPQSPLANNRYLLRLAADGTRDLTFLPNFDVYVINSVRLAADGKIYVTGTFGSTSARVIRLLENGSVDTTFVLPAGVTASTVVQVEPRPDGSLYLLGSFTVPAGARELVRLNADGTLDASFNSAAASGIGKFAVASDGSTYITTGAGGLGKLRPTGVQDTGFVCKLETVVMQGDRQFVFPASPSQVLQDPQGGVVLVGWGNRINGENASGPIRINTDGSRDSSFQAPANGVRIGSLVDDGFGHWLALGQFTSLDSTTLPGVARLFQRGPGATRLVNLSARALTGTGERALIAGFVMTGTGGRPLLVRGVGPALRSLGVTAALEAPKLVLYHGPDSVGGNEGWANDPNLVSAASRVGAFAFGAGSLDTAMWQMLPAGLYSTMIVAPEGHEGIALAETYDDGAAINNDTRLVNLSARAETEGGERVLIAGFVVVGTGEKQVLLRAVGPGLSGLGVQHVLDDPVLRVMQNGRLVAENDNWSSGSSPGYVAAAARQSGAFSLQGGSRDAAVLLRLMPGVYSVVVSPSDSRQQGIALVEVYEVSQ